MWNQPRLSVCLCYQRIASQPTRWSHPSIISVHWFGRPICGMIVIWSWEENERPELRDRLKLSSGKMEVSKDCRTIYNWVYILFWIEYYFTWKIRLMFWGCPWTQFPSWMVRWWLWLRVSLQMSTRSPPVFRFEEGLSDKWNSCLRLLRRFPNSVGDL